MARQVLSLVAGSAIDEYLLSQLRLLRQEHTLARLIHGLQNMLWPGGTWFQSAPNYPGKPPPRVGTCFLHQLLCSCAPVQCAFSTKGSIKAPMKGLWHPVSPQGPFLTEDPWQHGCSARALTLNGDSCCTGRRCGCAAPASSAAAGSPPLPGELPQPQVLRQPSMQCRTASVQDPSVPPPRPALITAEHFLQQPDAPPLDHEEINEAVYELLLSKGPSVLVRLIGRNCYQV